jgi:hypothetical protein
MVSQRVGLAQQRERLAHGIHLHKLGRLQVLDQPLHLLVKLLLLLVLLTLLLLRQHQAIGNKLPKV